MISCHRFCRLEEGELPLKLGEDPTGDTASFAGTAPLPLALSIPCPFPALDQHSGAGSPPLGWPKHPFRGAQHPAGASVVLTCWALTLSGISSKTHH